MSIFKLALAVLVAASCFAQGRPLTPDEIRAIDITIGPDGSNLPAGSGSVSAGLAVYTAKCQGCHGVEGAGKPQDRLTGGIGTLASDKPIKTPISFWPRATTLFDYIRRAMPIQSPGSLSNDEVYALTAYLLSIDAVIPKNAVLDAKTLPAVKMPNRDGFISHWPPRATAGRSGFVQNATYDKDPPALPADLKPGGILIFCKTNGYRDGPAIDASKAALAAIATRHNWPFFSTENGAVMNAEQLAKFKLVVWDNASGDPLTPDQRAAFKAWVENGGSFLGIHGAGGDPVENHGHTSLADWKWYVDTLIGAQFIVHSGIVPADIHVEDPASPIVQGLPPVWHRSEEWYAFDASSRSKPGFHILATVNESTYSPGRATMKNDHPLIWWHCVEKGHAVYSALGHAGSMYAEPLMIQLLDNAMAWGLAERGKGCPAR